jgi:hypothetical protein
MTTEDNMDKTNKTKLTIIIDPMQVKVGDKAYFKGYDFGFTVLEVDNRDPDLPFMVTTPFNDAGDWARSSHFDHATREVEDL